MKGKNILLIGAGGQIGTVLTEKLRELHGSEKVFATDLRENKEKNIASLDVMNLEKLEKTIIENDIQVIFHLAAILSATGEKMPQKAWDINMGSLFNVFELAVKHKIDRVFYPSSIAVFGEHIALDNTPNHTSLTPATVYGISKVSGELWANYFYEKYGLDVRSIRYPGVIGYQSQPGGGTTDYAVDIFYSAVKREKFECFLNPDTTLPMIYMDDCIRATIELMNAPKESIQCRTSYNVAGMSFSPEEIALAIQKIIPTFEIEYKPDYRQEIASTWPQSIDDSLARNDWNWSPEYNLEEMCKDMIENIGVGKQD